MLTLAIISACVLALGGWLWSFVLRVQRMREILPRWRTCYHCGKPHCGSNRICDDCQKGKS